MKKTKLDQANQLDDLINYESKNLAAIQECTTIDFTKGPKGSATISDCMNVELFTKIKRLAELEIKKKIVKLKEEFDNL